MNSFGQQLRRSTALLRSNVPSCCAGPSTFSVRQYSSQNRGRDREFDELDETEVTQPDMSERDWDDAIADLTPDQRMYLRRYPQFPNIMRPIRAVDSREVLSFPPTAKSPYRNTVIERDPDPYANEAQIRAAILHQNKRAEEREKAAAAHEARGFDKDAKPQRRRRGEEEDDPDYDAWRRPDPSKSEDDRPEPSVQEVMLEHQLKLATHRYYLINRRITQQTGKGKIHRMAVCVVVGNGNGLLGVGAAKGDESEIVRKRALLQAVSVMDHVERFEDRTIWTDVESKFGATKIIMRPRPVGFGLRCHPVMHQILKAAGIKDISAKVWGSRNDMMVLKGTMRMLLAGNAPMLMGDGAGGSARKMEKGTGIRGLEDLQLDRGRLLYDLRTW